MKKSMLISTLLLAIFSSFGQEYQKPAEGKSLVYFVRFSATGALINFKYFDGEKYLGKINGINYFTYECDPGQHTFWAASENRDFIKGDLKPNATYIVEVRPAMGAVKAGVKLFPIEPGNEKKLKKIDRLLSKKSASELKGKDEDMDFFIENGMERLKKIEQDVKVINSDWTH